MRKVRIDETYQSYHERKRELLALAHWNRKHMTPAERTLWSHLKCWGLGVRFCSQGIFPPFYIADFVCYSKRLVVEVDGPSHSRRARKDTIRTLWLKRQGYAVLRFSNDEILHDCARSIERIREVIMERSRYPRHAADRARAWIRQLHRTRFRTSH